MSGLYVQEEWVDRAFLASSYIHTPDPRQESPPKGQRLLVAWKLPRSCPLPGSTLQIHVWLWDNTFQEIYCQLPSRRGSEAFFFPNEDPTKDQRILTYQVQMRSGEGELIDSWEHHFWTKFIDIKN